MLSLGYSIVHKKGIENGAADALSRREDTNEAELHSITVLQPQWMEDIIKSYDKDEWATENLTAALIAPTIDNLLSVSQGLLRYKNRLYVGSIGSLRRGLILKLHETTIGGHFGQTRTYQRLKSLFY